MSKNHLIAQAAEQLWQAKQNSSVCDPIRELAGEAGFSLEEAYQIQLLNTQREVAQGRRIIGHKIGLTSKVVQTQLGVDQPDFGCLFDDMIFYSSAIKKQCFYGIKIGCIVCNSGVENPFCKSNEIFIFCNEVGFAI